MKDLRISITGTAALLFTLGLFTACESTDGGGGGSVSGSFYYGVGFSDPWSTC